MYLDVIIRRNISFVGCILIIAATELNKISRSLFTALQWRRRCISSSFSFNSYLVHIRRFFGVIRLLNRRLSIFRSCELIQYLAIAVMRWSPVMCKIYGSTQKYFLLMHMCAAYSSYHFRSVINTDSLPRVYYGFSHISMHFYANIAFFLKLDNLAPWVYIWSAPN